MKINTVVYKEFETKSLTEIRDAPVNGLPGESDSDAQKLKDAFNIKTVKDLATNRFFLRALANSRLASADK